MNCQMQIVMPVELFVAYRHLRRRIKQNTLILTSITLGVCAVIVFLSIANGFQMDLTERVLGLTSHLVVIPRNGPVFGTAETIATHLDQLEKIDIVGTAPGLLTQGLLVYKQAVRSIQIRGVDPEKETLVSTTLDKLTSGSLADFTQDAVMIGSGIAEWLRAQVGDFVQITFPSQNTARFRIAGVFDSGVAQYDNSFVYLPLETVQRLLAQPGAISEIRLRLADPFEAAQAAEEIKKEIPSVEAITWQQLNRSLFEALVVEKRVYTLVLSLMLVIVGFAIANVVGLHVVQRQRDIAILSTMGLALHRIRRIFVMEGILLGMAGAILGCLVATALTWLIGTIEIPISGSFAPGGYVPVYLSLTDILLAVGLGIGVSVSSSYFPARRISAEMPVEVLRYG